MELIVSLVDGVGLMALAAVLYGVVERLHLSRTARSILHGVTFGICALFAMLSPINVVPGVMADPRAIFVALAGAFVGPVAAVVAVVPPAVYRVWVGGVGMPMGLVTLAFAFAVGLAWRYLWFKRRPVTSFGLLVLGGAIAPHSLLYMLIPAQMNPSVLTIVIASLTLISLFATQVLGAMMGRENHLIAREKSLLDDAYTDALTGLPNRRAVLQAETRVKNRSRDKGFVVLLLDIDHFKSINDRFGHDSGDLALCTVARVLKTGTREGDIVARFGGEEFVIVLPATQAEEGRVVGQRLLSLVRENRMVLADTEVAMRVSIGLAVAEHETVLEAISRCDEALYAAKAAGRDRLVTARPEAPAQLRTPSTRVRPSVVAMTSPSGAAVQRAS